MVNLNEVWLDIYCPKCKYQFEVQMIDVKLESKVCCHNCKHTIQLKDSKTSIHESTRDINQALNELDQVLRNMFK